MKKLLLTLAVLALPAATALGASSNSLHASPSMFLESQLPARIHLFGRTTCRPGSQVTITSRALKSTHRSHGAPAVSTKVGQNHKFSVTATIKPGPYATVEIPVNASCAGHTFAHNISIQAY